MVLSSDMRAGCEAANRLEYRRLAHVGGIMKKALFTLGLFLFCSAFSQNAMAKPTKSVKSAKVNESSSKGLGLNALGVDAGLVDPEGASSTLGLGVFADLGNLAPDVRLSTHVGYWSKSE